MTNQFELLLSFLIILIGTPAAFQISMILKNKIALPVICTIPGFASYFIAVQQSIVAGFIAILFWTLVQSTIVIRSSLKDSESTVPMILKSESYAASMFQWIETGILPEGRPVRVLLFHLIQGAVYCILAVCTANVASMILGCVLLNHMNFYVAKLMNQSRNPAAAVFIGWNPWSIIRVAAFLWLGSALGTVLLSAFVNVPLLRTEYLYLGLIGVALDVSLKILCSEPWRLLIKRQLKA